MNRHRAGGYVARGRRREVGTPTRLVPTYLGSDQNGASGTLSTTCAIGDFLLFWETATGLVVPTEPSGFTSIDFHTINDTNDISARLSYRFAPSANYVVTREGTTAGRACLAWYSNVDVSTPIVLQAKNAGVATPLAIPALASFGGEEYVVAAVTRRFGTNATDFTAPITLRVVANAASAEARLGDTDGLVTGFTGLNLSLTGSTTSWLTQVVALLGALP